jgi:hypothetical protein
MTTPDPTNPGTTGATGPIGGTGAAGAPGDAVPPTPAEVNPAQTGPEGATAAPGAVPPPAGATPPPAYGSAPPAYGSAPPAYGAPPAWSGSAPAAARPEPRPAGLVLGIILIVVGALFLALRLANIELGADAWPLWLIVPGIAMLAGSLFIPFRGGLGLGIPGAIIATVGIILWVQAAYDLYATWAYAWALVAPTAPGLAMLAYGAVHRDGDLVRDGLGATVTGLGLFVGFGIFFEGVVGISGHRIEHIDQVLPYAAIGLGVVLIALALVDGGRRDAWRDQRRAERRAERDRQHAERAARRAAR